MKRLINFATSLPVVAVLGGVIVSVTAILSQYPGAKIIKKRSKYPKGQLLLGSKPRLT